MSNIFILGRWYISLMQNPTIAHILICLLNKSEFLALNEHWNQASPTLSQVPAVQLHQPVCITPRSQSAPKVGQNLM